MSAGSLLGYLDRWSVFPGETVVCRASAVDGDDYHAELVRIIQGDRHPHAPGYRVERMDLDLGGPFAARFQPLETGSLAIVETLREPGARGSFSIVATIWPTTPDRGEQVLFSRRDHEGGSGFELAIDEHGALRATAWSNGTGVAVSTGRALLTHRWYKAGLSVDAESGALAVIQQPLEPHPLIDDAGSASTAIAADPTLFGRNAPLTMAAALDEEGRARCHYNGRIHDPHILDHALTGVGGDTRPTTGVITAWDFAIDISSTRIADISGNGCHGRLVNLPTRGVTGPDWDGSCHAWPHDASHYGAIHFHDDDLYDANWRESFRFTLPDDLASGIYSVRLYRGDDEFHMPFAVRAPHGNRGSDVVFLLPTASYMAYANNRIGLDVPETELVCGRLIELDERDLYMQEHPELGLCFYDLHNDGSGVYYSSRLRPVMDLQPGFVGKLGGAGSRVWQFNADTHITGWFEHAGRRFDVVTDEDLHHEGAACLDGYRVLVTGSHPEYYSAAMRDALDAFVAGGGRLMYIGGNGFYWRVSFHPELPGVIECRKSEDGIRAFAPGPGEYYASFTGEYTGLWRRNGRPPNTLAGVGMVAQGFDRSSPFVRSPESRDSRVAFMFEGIDGEVIGDFGLSGGGAAGIELDGADITLGTPPHALVVASSERHSDLYLVTPEDMLDPVPGLGGTESELIRADVVFFETPAGGAVFSTGSIAWAGSMAWNGYRNDVARLTENVLTRFLDPAPFTAPDDLDD